MKTLHLSALKHQIIAFETARRFLHNVGFQPKTHEENISYGVMTPLSVEAVASRNQSHLTHSTGVDEQIRFMRMERVLRHFRRICHTSDRCEPISVTIFDADNLDDGSRIFFKELSAVCKHIRVYLSFSANASSTDQHCLSDGEIAIEQMCKNLLTISAENRDFLFNKAKEYVYLGNYWTSLAICKQLVKSENSARVHYLLGISYSFFEQTSMAEHHFKMMHSVGNNSEKVKASYVLAMLFARHHPKHLRDDDIAEAYLESAYAILQQSTHEDFPDLDFQRVFNRNGYALIIYRKKRVDEAKNYLVNGIEKLKNHMSGTVHLHSSVLMYNLSLCYKALGDNAMAIETFEALVAIDPHFPEYRLELAKCLMAEGNLKKAESVLKEALALDTNNPDTHSICGALYAKLEACDLALHHYGLAWEEDNTNPEFAYDYSYYLVMANEPEKALAVLDCVDPTRLYPAIADDIFSLKANIAAHLSDAEKGEAIIDEGLLLVPASKVLLENRQLLRA